MSRRHPSLVLETSWFNAVIECFPDAVFLVNAQDFRVVCANPSAGKIFACEPMLLIGKHIQEICSSIEDAAFWQEVAEWNMGLLGEGPEPSIDSETTLQRLDGSTLHAVRRVRYLSFRTSQAGFMVIVHDRTHQREFEGQLEEKLAEFAATLDMSPEGIMVMDRAGKIRHFNHRFAALWSIPDQLMLQREDQLLWDWIQSRLVDPNVWQKILQSTTGIEKESEPHHVVLCNGRVLECQLVSTSSGGRPLMKVLSFRDATERIETKRRISTLSSTDSLTGLPNRLALDESITVALRRAQDENETFALMAVDLDHFQHINNSLGYHFGDRVLIEVAERLKSCLRHVDVVARLGSDEFVMILNRVNSKSAEAAGQRILKTMAQPFRLNGISFTVTCSIGVALCPVDGVHLEDLMLRAQAALNLVKATGRSAVRLHDSNAMTHEFQIHARKNILLDHAMRLALPEGRFRLNYQPQVDLRTGGVLGAEALLRWFDPELGHISPAEFIPVAEETGFIVEIGHWVLNQAVHQAAQWHQSGHSLLVSVNVSALQFQQANFVESVAEILQHTQLPPRLLELELTESILIQNEKVAIERLDTLACMGVKLAIDDFGTGYSSLGYLKKLPINRLKIDRSFLRGLPVDQNDVGIVNAVIYLGRALGLRIVAEGVETEIQRQFLEAAGCEQYQGFLFAPALDVSAFMERLKTG